MKKKIGALKLLTMKSEIKISINSRGIIVLKQAMSVEVFSKAWNFVQILALALTYQL